MTYYYDPQPKNTIILFDQENDEPVTPDKMRTVIRDDKDGTLYFPPIFGIEMTKRQAEKDGISGGTLGDDEDYVYFPIEWQRQYIIPEQSEKLTDLIDKLKAAFADFDAKNNY